MSGIKTDAFSQDGSANKGFGMGQSDDGTPVEKPHETELDQSHRQSSEISDIKSECESSAEGRVDKPDIGPSAGLRVNSNPDGQVLSPNVQVNPADTLQNLPDPIVVENAHDLTATMDSLQPQECHQQNTDQNNGSLPSDLALTLQNLQTLHRAFPNGDKPLYNLRQPYEYDDGDESVLYLSSRSSSSGGGSSQNHNLTSNFDFGTRGNRTARTTRTARYRSTNPTYGTNRKSSKVVLVTWC